MTDRICSVEYCGRVHLASGWCSMHYQRAKKHGDPMAGARERHFCTIDGCESPVVGRGWCEKHYRRWQSHGDPLVTTIIRGDIVSRFESYLAMGEVPAHAPDLGRCWSWTGGVDPDGYGKFRAPGEQFAHRWSYTHHVGPIPRDLELDHLCRIRHCVNPWHLDPVTRLVNILRAAEVRYGRDSPDAAPC